MTVLRVLQWESMDFCLLGWSQRVLRTALVCPLSGFPRADLFNEATRELVQKPKHGFGELCTFKIRRRIVDQLTRVLPAPDCPVTLSVVSLRVHKGPKGVHDNDVRW